MEWGYIDGSCTLAGVDLLSLGPQRATNVLYALAVNETNGLVNKAEVREALDRSLRPSAPVGVDPASTLHAWGATPEAQDGQDAMMRLLG